MDSEEDAEKKKKKKESHRPNYFVSIPITNTQVRMCISSHSCKFVSALQFCTVNLLICEYNSSCGVKK